MGQVFRATNRETGVDVAAKLLRPELASDPTLVARFVQERHLLTAVDDPHVVRILDLVVEGDTLGIVAELVRGPDLRRYLVERGTLAPAVAASITAQVLRGLAAVHARGIIHRDVKPENVLLEDGGSQPLAKLGDFGIARLADGPSLTRLTGVIGTPDYLAPELAERSAPTLAADVYGAGIMAYELLCGVPPFSGGHAMAVLKGHAERPPPRIPGVPDELWAVLVPMLAKDPGQRPGAAGAAEALERLAPALAACPPLPVLTEPPGGVGGPNEATVLRPDTPGLAPIARPPFPAVVEPPREAPSRRRRLLLVCVLALAVLAAAVVVGLDVFTTAASASVSFPVSVTPGGVVVQRTWRLTGGALGADVTLTNGATTTAAVTYDEVVPKSVAPSAASIRNVVPAPSMVVAQDPVLRFSLPDVLPGSTRHITYAVSVGGGGAPRTRSPDGRPASRGGGVRREHRGQDHHPHRDRGPPRDRRGRGRRDHHAWSLRDHGRCECGAAIGPRGHVDLVAAGCGLGRERDRQGRLPRGDGREGLAWRPAGQRDRHGRCSGAGVWSTRTYPDAAVHRSSRHRDAQPTRRARQPCWLADPRHDAWEHTARYSEPCRLVPPTTGPVAAGGRQCSG